MVAPDWCAIAVGLEVAMRATNNMSPVVESCTTLFQNYLKHCRNPTWKHILEVVESEAVGRKMCATFIKTILPGACSEFVIIVDMLFKQKSLILNQLNGMQLSNVMIIVMLLQVYIRVVYRKVSTTGHVCNLK